MKTFKFDLHITKSKKLKSVILIKKEINQLLEHKHAQS